MSIEQASKYLGVSRTTLWRLQRAGRLPSVMVAGCRRFRVSALDAAVVEMPAGHTARW